MAIKFEDSSGFLISAEVKQDEVIIGIKGEQDAMYFYFEDEYELDRFIEELKHQKSKIAKVKSISNN